ncbi:hypothetical protein [Bradyrhizobium septentrionale]|uniref:Uncharacterized protein n=1 Tax=Bradyrhizobium septentrionale TaxID=1404411 RepID=A0ABZ2P4Q3_9BRAD
MSRAKPEIPLEDVLLAFSVEPVHDRATLERYLNHYPQFAEDLVDMSHELRIGGRGVSGSVEDDATVQRALKQLIGAAAQVSGAAANPFDAFRGLAFAELADTLRVPRSILIALRDRLVIESSVPPAFAIRLARSARTTVADLMAYLQQPPVLAATANYKADQKPSTSGKVALDALLDASGVTPEQKVDIYTSAD